ncbi:hypothetical protein VTJ04DRAFT_9995 [Mycothermus thermophilus]|uniref:uncharacterized protein n=1 Tax=Humicola insolens TaxID=85995 RepID=UPI0037437FD6
MATPHSFSGFDWPSARLVHWQAGAWDPTPSFGAALLLLVAVLGGRPKFSELSQATKDLLGPVADNTGLINRELDTGEFYSYMSRASLTLN